MRKRQLPDTGKAPLGCRPDGRLVGAVQRGRAEFDQAIDRGACAVVLCHGDLFPDDMIWGRDGLVVLDWETASLDCAVLDIGVTAVACCRDGDHVDWTRVRTLGDGYTTTRPLRLVNVGRPLSFRPRR